MSPQRPAGKDFVAAAIFGDHRRRLHEELRRRPFRPDPVPIPYQRNPLLIAGRAVVSRVITGTLTGECLDHGIERAVLRDLDQDENVGVDLGQDLLDGLDPAVILMIEPANVPRHDVQKFVGAAKARRNQFLCVQKLADAIGYVAATKKLELRYGFSA